MRCHWFEPNGEGAAEEGGVGSDAREAHPARGRLGKLLSAARRRHCIDRVTKKFDVSERLACRVLGQHRSTQRKVPRGRADEAALTADIVALASQYGRYGYRRIAAMLRDARWAVNVKRVQRIWRREGLKVPQKQPKKGRLWLNDGSCIRLGPEHPNHVWSYDFVESRTVAIVARTDGASDGDGRKFRMLNLIDAFARECLGAGRPEAQPDRRDQPAVRSVHPPERAGPHPVGQRPRVHRQVGEGADRRRRGRNRRY